MNEFDIDEHIAQIKAGTGAAGIGMILSHQGIVRDSSKTGHPVSGMRLGVDRAKFAEALAQAHTWKGIVAVDGWVGEGDLKVGDDIMKLVVAGDVRENVFEAMQRLVRVVKSDVLTETELR